jgi:hypothetical protein
LPLYFAYGSNMDEAAMRRRCPSSRALGPARLMRHRFFIMAHGYASIIRDPALCVYGLLWDLASRDVAALDRYENVAAGLYSKMVQPVLADGGARRALVYVGVSTRPGPPKPGYLEAVIAAAAAAGLPASYVASLAQYQPRHQRQGQRQRRAEGLG